MANHTQPNRLQQNLIHNGREQFDRLVDAIDRGDHKLIFALREYWSEIAAYLETDDPQPTLPSEKQATLILWLSTRPPHHPVQWISATSTAAVESVNQQIAAVDQVWNAWIDWQPLIVALEETLAEDRFPDPHGWCEHARACFEALENDGHIQSIADPRRRLDVIAGYGAYVDQLLVGQKLPIPESGIEVIGFSNPSVLRLASGLQLSMDDMAATIAFRSGVKRRTSVRFAEAITLSLPVHRDVLPNVTIRMERSSYWLVSTRVDPLAVWRELEAERENRTVVVPSSVSQ